MSFKDIFSTAPDAALIERLAAKVTAAQAALDAARLASQAAEFDAEDQNTDSARGRAAKALAIFEAADAKLGAADRALTGARTRKAAAEAQAAEKAETTRAAAARASVEKVRELAADVDKRIDDLAASLRQLLDAQEASIGLCKGSEIRDGYARIGGALQLCLERLPTSPRSSLYDAERARMVFHMPAVEQVDQ